MFEYSSVRVTCRIKGYMFSNGCCDGDEDGKVKSNILISYEASRFTFENFLRLEELSFALFKTDLSLARNAVKNDIENMWKRYHQGHIDIVSISLSA